MLYESYNSLYINMDIDKLFRQMSSQFTIKKYIDKHGYPVGNGIFLMHAHISTNRDLSRAASL